MKEAGALLRHLTLDHEVVRDVFRDLAQVLHASTNRVAVAHLTEVD